MRVKTYVFWYENTKNRICKDKILVFLCFCISIHILTQKHRNLKDEIHKVLPDSEQKFFCLLMYMALLINYKKY